MNDDVRVQWTDTRVVAVLLIPLMATIALITAAASAGPTMSEAVDVPSKDVPSFEVTIPSIALDDSALRTGTAGWALELLDTLAIYEAIPAEKYDRDTYDVGWLDVDGDCQSGRHELLITESLEAVELDDEGCRVMTGFWRDPYAGTEIRTAQEASIDHVVSLADAHRSGGWRWTHEWRVAFANDLDDPATLAVSATRVNSAKGSEPPDRWMPESDEARCSYAVAWVRVKTRWKLAATDAEQATLRDTLRWCNANALPNNVDETPLAIVDFTESPYLPVDRTREIDEGDECDVRYESACIPAVTGDLDCGDIEPRRFAVTVDPHNFDGDDNGIGCER